MAEKNIIWESCGYLPFFGIPIKSHHYTLYRDSITVRSGISLQKIQSTKLHNIITKEMTASPIARLFHCGRIRLITWGETTPDLEMFVKKPEEVLALIESTKEEDHVRFLANRQKNNYRRHKSNNKPKSAGGSRNVKNDAGGV